MKPASNSPTAATGGTPTVNHSGTGGGGIANGSAVPNPNGPSPNGSAQQSSSGAPNSTIGHYIIGNLQSIAESFNANREGFG